jgi:hypothetical protein
MAFSTITSEQATVIVPFSTLADGDCFYDGSEGVCRRVNASTYQKQDGALISSVLPTKQVRPVDVKFVWSYAV